MNFSSRDIDKIEVIGDRILIKPTSPDHTTKSGLLLPPSVQEKEIVQTGYVIKVGPGYPIPNMDAEESWKPASEHIRYIPLQIHEGDLAVFLQNKCYEIQFNNEMYYISSQSSVLMVLRNDF